MDYKIVEGNKEGTFYWYACPDNWWSKFVIYDYLLSGIGETVTYSSKEECKRKLNYHLGKKILPKVVEIVKGE